MLPHTVAPTDLLDTIGGIPLHPLIVHAAVVILPLGALGLVAIILVPRWRATFGWLVMGALAAGTLSAFAAVNSGEALADRVGEPERHAELGETLQVVAAILFLAAAAWFWLQRRSSAPATVLGGPLQAVAAIATLALAAGTLVLTVLVGHSGAESVWGSTVATSSTAEGDTEPGDEASDDSEDDDRDDDGSGDDGSGDDGTAAPPASPEATTVITMAEVAANATASSCWAAIDGTVYDLTAWVSQHPGGAERILAICGTDASAAFGAQHAGDTQPAAELTAFELGSLG